MIPWSSGWRRLVQLGGKKTSLMLDSERTGWAGQLSMKSKMCLFWHLNLWFIAFSHSSKIDTVIQAFLFALYSTGNVFLFLKHRSFSDFPITNGGSLSDPSIFPQRRSVTRSFDCLPPEHDSPFSTWDLFGRHLKNNPVLSALNMSFGW